MKKLFLLLISVLLINTALEAKGSKVKTLTIKISFKGVEEGYDHLTKSDIYIDGNLVGSTVEHKETRSISKTIEVPNGKFDLKIVNFAYYEANWEEHTIENSYSIDCVVDDSFTVGKKKNLVIVFDLDDKTNYQMK